MMKLVIKRLFYVAGVQVARRDPLVESIPPSYEGSLFLPRVYRQSISRIICFHDMIERVRQIRGDIVECGTSIGHGLLFLILLNELTGIERIYYGFDSFEGSPEPTDEDSGTHAYKGFYATPPGNRIKGIA